MKKLSILLFAFLLSIPLFGHTRERLDPESNFIYVYLRAAKVTILPEVVVTAYRNPQDSIKHQQQKFSSQFEIKGGRGYLLPKDANNDDLYYTPKSDTIKHARHPKNKTNNLYSKDTLQYSDVNTDEDPFIYSNRIAMFYHGGFNPWYYNDLFYYNSFFFDDFYWDWNYSLFYPYDNFYFGWGWGWPWYNHFWYQPYWYPYYHRHHNHDYWHDGGRYYAHNGYTQINRRQSYSTMSNHSGLSQVNTIQRRSANTSIQNKPVYRQNQNRRSYQPSYNSSRMSERPLYNNTHTYNNIQNRSINHTNTVTNQTRSNYSAPNRSSTVRNYSLPNRSSYQHNSNSSYRSSGSNYSGGGNYRSSGSSFSGGGSSASHSSNSSGGGGSRRR
jgi:hypothetical protein